MMKKKIQKTAPQNDGLMVKLVSNKQIQINANNNTQREEQHTTLPTIAVKQNNITESET